MQVTSKYDLLKKIDTAILSADGFKPIDDQDLVIAKAVLKILVPYIKFIDKGMAPREFVEWRKSQLDKVRKKASEKSAQPILLNLQQKTVDVEDVEDLFNIINKQMDEAVEAACKADGRRCYIDYSAYSSDDNDNPINNLNDIAAHGNVILFRDKDECWGGEKSRGYQSPVLTNPTWLTCAIHANRSVIATKDRHHVFFEDVSATGREVNGALMYEIEMGS